VEKLYTYKEASEILGVSVGTLRRWVKEGKVKSTTLTGGGKRIKESALVQANGNGDGNGNGNGNGNANGSANGNGDGNGKAPNSVDAEIKGIEDNARLLAARAKERKAQEEEALHAANIKNVADLTRLLDEVKRDSERVAAEKEALEPARKQLVQEKADVAKERADIAQMGEAQVKQAAEIQQSNARLTAKVAEAQATIGEAEEAEREIVSQANVKAKKIKEDATYYDTQGQQAEWWQKTYHRFRETIGLSIEEGATISQYGIDKWYWERKREGWKKNLKRLFGGGHNV